MDHEKDFAAKEIIINIRYIRDLLTNRAGAAPNKKASAKIINEPCLFPFTDMTIFSNGNVGICCNDATERSKLGNVMEESLQKLWTDEKAGEIRYSNIRRYMVKGRAGWSFCQNCDTLDTGLRVRISSKVIHHAEK